MCTNPWWADAAWLQKTKERRQTRRSLTKLQGGEAIIHQLPHLLKSSQLPAPFKMRVMGALSRSLPRCLAAGFRPPPVEPPTSSPLPQQHIIISDSHWRRRTARGGVAVGEPSRAATANGSRRGCSWAELFSREDLCVWWRAGGSDRGMERGWWEVCEKDLRQSESPASFTMCWCDAHANGLSGDSSQNTEPVLRVTWC